MKKIARKAKEPEIDTRFAAVVGVFSRHRDVVAGRLMSSYGLKVGGKIFAMFGKGRYVVKLPKARVDMMVEAGNGKRFDPGHGRLMKEWIVVEAEKADWIGLAQEAYRYVKLGPEG